MEDNNYGRPTRTRKRRYNVKRIVALLIILVAIIAAFVMLIKWIVSGGTPRVEEPKEEFVQVLVKPWEDMSDNETISILSGLPVLKDEASHRPVAIMYHNRLDTLPQVGLSKAEIVYEVPTDGEIVSLLGIFQDMSLAKYGPIRSIRNQAIDYAFDNDAILVHYKSGEVAQLGGAITKQLTTLNSANIDASSYEDEMTSSEVIAAGTTQAEASTSSEAKVTESEQTVKFVSGSGVKSVWDKKGYAKMREADKQVKMFNFSASDDTKFDSIANTVSIDYSYYQKSEFRYDPKSCTYKRWQTLGYKEAQQVDSMGTSDTTDDEPLEYKNVIIQFVESTTDSATNNIEINTVSSGEGYYFTNGTYEPIKWSKSDHYESTIYTDLAGNVIDFNRGKTWIAMVPKNITPTISEELKDSGLTSSSIKTKTVNKLEAEGMLVVPGSTAEAETESKGKTKGDKKSSDISTIGGIDAQPISSIK